MNIKFRKIAEKTMNQPVVNTYEYEIDGKKVEFSDIRTRLNLYVYYTDIPEFLNPCHCNTLDSINFRNNADKLGMTYANYFGELVRYCNTLTHKDVVESEINL